MTNRTTIGSTPRTTTTATYSPSAVLPTGVSALGVSGSNTPATSPPGSPCTVRQYTFDKNGNRTRLINKSEGGGNCFWAGTAKDLNYTYDNADRPLTAGAATGGAAGAAYVYDSLGRQTTLPAADAPDSTRGNITLGYYDDDLIRSITQGGVTTTYQLDTLGRRQNSTTTGAGAPTDGTTIRHYTDTSDNPAWSSDPAGNVSRYVSSLAGYAGTITATGAVSLAIANPHSDNVTTVNLPASQAETTPATSIGAWSDFDEYGVSKTNQPLGTGYGYLGQAQRATTPEAAGLTLMGARILDPSRGSFTSQDPIARANATVYSYPLDPVSDRDISGSHPTYGRYAWALCAWWNLACKSARWAYAAAVGAQDQWIAKMSAPTASYRGPQICEGVGYPAQVYAQRGGTTWGTVFLTRTKSIRTALGWYRFDRLVSHELEHVYAMEDIWNWFPYLYLLEGANPCRNYFEIKAGLSLGGYSC